MSGYISYFIGAMSLAFLAYLAYSYTTSPSPPPPQPKPDCSLFKNRKQCNCVEEENRGNPWCMTKDDLYETKNCDGMCKEKTGESRCTVHYRSTPKQFLYYCAPLRST